MNEACGILLTETGASMRLKHLLAVTVTLFWLVPPLQADELACKSSNHVDAPYCNYVSIYHPSDKSFVNPAISSALSISSDETTRSVALIAGVGIYQHRPDLNLPSVEVDVKNLVSFFRDIQHFDEVIVLQNNDVTLDNLNYFLSSYLPGVADRYSKARIVFSYTGHGIPPSAPNANSSLVLANARSDGDSINLLSMGQVRQYFNELSTHGHQFLALINACYGGGIFGFGLNGGNIFLTDAQGANALTAGAPDELVYSLGMPGQGSIFFDNIINGIDTGEAAGVYSKSDAVGHVVHIRRDVVRLGDILNHLTQSIEDINTLKHSHYSTPWEGAVTPPSASSKGGFFFLSGMAQAQSFDAAGAPSGAVSSIRGRPDIKVFNDPKEYPVHGIDVSQYSGEANWSKVKMETLARYPQLFVYVRSTMGSDRLDEKFMNNWAGISEEGMLRGAYHVYDLCDDPVQQLDHFTEALKSVGYTKDNMPAAIDVEYYTKSSNAWQQERLACAKTKGLQTVSRELLAFSNGVMERLGKRPLIFGNEDVFRDLVDKSFRSFPVWLHDYAGGDSGNRLPGSNPWTFWQYSNSSKFYGIQNPVDSNVFYSTHSDFLNFVKTGENLSLKAASDDIK